MSGTVAGIAGTAIGLGCAVAAVMAEHVRRARTGEASGSVTSEVIGGFREGYRSHGVERYVLTRAAAWSFAAILVASALYALLEAIFSWTNSAWWPVWGVWAVGGTSFGLACGLIGRRTS